jgi:hypothetical protein
LEEVVFLLSDHKNLHIPFKPFLSGEISANLGGVFFRQLIALTAQAMR